MEKNDLNIVRNILSSEGMTCKEGKEIGEAFVAGVIEGMAEFEKRMNDLRCNCCAYVERGFKTCLNVIDSADIYSSCPYRKQKK